MKMTDRAVAMYGAGIPIAEIEEYTGMTANAIYSRASRRGVKRPKSDIDVRAIEMDIQPAAVEEAREYWNGVSRRHAEYWNRYPHNQL